MSRQRGFTILELMIATTIFSVILLILSGAIVTIGRTYYKGILQTRNQETARRIADTISDAIRYSGSSDMVYKDTGGPPGARSYCFGNVLVSYLDPSSDGNGANGSLTINRSGSSCNGSTPNPADGEQFLQDRQRVLSLSITSSPDTGLHSIDVVIATGENDLFEPVGIPNAASTCKGDAGLQFCTKTYLSAKVQKRVK